jgi:ABC-2 type transport system ATP-binding protein
MRAAHNDGPAQSWVFKQSCSFGAVDGVVAEGLVKRFGSFTALKGVDFVVPEGALVGLLGPNGAGKTTTIRILTTLLQPDGGRATVAGFDVVREPQLVRSVIGLTGQFAAIDEDLTGRENLILVGRLGRMRKSKARDRAAELLELFALVEAADRPLRTYSGGMRRRADVAASLMVAPAVLFLDEPTTGLDPRSRLGLWDVIAELKDQGTTIVLTTQYLEEADQLCETISVIDIGQIIAEGTADELKTMVGGDVLELTVADRAFVDKAVGALARTFGLPETDVTVDRDLGIVAAPVTTGADALVPAVRALDAEEVPIADMGLRRPSLDDVFLSLTGHVAEETRIERPDPGSRRFRARG